MWRLFKAIYTMQVRVPTTRRNNNQMYAHRLARAQRDHRRAG